MAHVGSKISLPFPSRLHGRDTPDVLSGGGVKPTLRRRTDPDVQLRSDRPGRLLHCYILALYVLAVASLPALLLSAFEFHFSGVPVYAIPFLLFAHPMLLAGCVANTVFSIWSGVPWGVTFWLVLAPWCGAFLGCSFPLMKSGCDLRGIGVAAVVGLELGCGVAFGPCTMAV